MDDITPYSDIYYGIVYANKFCAMCNGYLINDNITDETYNLTVKIVSPWTIKILCKHYQNLYRLTNEYDFFFAAAKSSQYKITLNPPRSKIRPKKCTERLNKNLKHVCTHQDSVEDQMCQTLPRRKYLQVGQMANIFCFLCDDQMKLFCEDSFIRGRTIISSTIRKPPIRELFEAEIRNNFNSTDSCVSPLDCRDFQVVCLNRTFQCFSCPRLTPHYFSHLQSI
ncbi:hypothetical protein Bpfe_012263 [Biomphalaria pfeifferi]|uniref:Uncharacterized protein n=1 Tax=Biomphalaria pfeifferi TaxID=112525 RepID=A0AAD8FAY1_BIOPF|nr:hypothetical protein Bpfe_012263 [Biomphalaria pfeifferi]